ncbi:MAG: hypothetical protein ACRDLB_12355 [Actinomycetota bacterium]
MQPRIVVMLAVAVLLSASVLVAQVVRAVRSASLDRACAQLVLIYDGNHLGTQVRRGEPDIRPKRGALSKAAAEIKKLHPECAGHL